MIQGVVLKYDEETQLAEVISVETTPKVFYNVRVKTLVTEDCILHIPLTKGTSGLLMFPEECEQFVLEGEIQKTVQFDTISAVFIPGFNSLSQNPDIPQKGVYFKFKDVELKIDGNKIELTNGSTNLEIDGNKFEVTNALSNLIPDLIEIIETLETMHSTGLSVTIEPLGNLEVPVNPLDLIYGPLLIQFEAIKTKLNSLT